MPTSVYIENPDDSTKRIKPNTDGSVNIGNLPTTQPVSGTVTAAPSIPAPGDIVRGSATASGTIYTVPANRTFYGSVSLSGCVALAGSSQPSISIPSGTIHQITINGLALVSVASANTISDVYISGGASGTAVTFNAGATGTSSGQIAGRLL